MNLKRAEIVSYLKILANQIDNLADSVENGEFDIEGNINLDIINEWDKETLKVED